VMMTGTSGLIKAIISNLKRNESISLTKIWGF
jgi:hypothetical protein